MRVVSYALKNFKSDSAGRVPLQGLQANQMLRVRPTLEGRLELVKGTEKWSHCTLPGRGIAPSLAQRRDREVSEWPENVPPVPDWDELEGPMLMVDDLPETKTKLEKLYKELKEMP